MNRKFLNEWRPEGEQDGHTQTCHCKLSYASLCIRVTSTVLPTTIPHHTHKSSIVLHRCTVLHGGFTSGSLHRTSALHFQYY